MGWLLGIGLALVGFFAFMGKGNAANGNLPSPSPTPKSPARPSNSSASIGKQTIRLGSKGEAVKKWQKIIGVTTDGIFGPITESVTKTWQRERGLVADGIVGPKTWTEAMSYPVGM